MKLRINDLNYEYKKGKKVLEGVNLNLDATNLVAIMGPNGAGKSTLMKIILGLVKVDDNKVFIDDVDLNTLDNKARSHLIASVEQNLSFSDETVFDSIMVGRIDSFRYEPKEEDYNRVYEVIKELNLEELMFRNVLELSGGERQKVGIARALVKDSKILYLDEITSNLDLRNEIEIIKLIINIAKEKNLLVLFNIHDLSLALNYFDYFILLNNKNIVKAGNIDELSSDDINKVFNVTSKIIEVDNKKVIIME